MSEDPWRDLGYMTIVGIWGLYIIFILICMIGVILEMID